MPFSGLNLKTLVTGKAKNAFAEIAYSGVMYKDALSILICKFGQPQTIIKAHLEKLKRFPPLKCIIPTAL